MAMKRGNETLELSPIKAKYPALIAFIKNGGNESQPLIELWPCEAEKKGAGAMRIRQKPHITCF
jgi:hypothetical protein